jgi:hypothetical protein
LKGFDPVLKNENSADSHLERIKDKILKAVRKVNFKLEINILDEHKGATSVVSLLKLLYTGENGKAFGILFD